MPTPPPANPPPLSPPAPAPRLSRAALLALILILLTPPVAALSALPRLIARNVQITVSVPGPAGHPQPLPAATTATVPPPRAHPAPWVLWAPILFTAPLLMAALALGILAITHIRAAPDRLAGLALAVFDVAFPAAVLLAFAVVAL